MGHYLVSTSRVGGLLPVANASQNGFIAAGDWAMITKRINHIGKTRILKITIVGYEGAAAYRERYLVYRSTIDSTPTEITRYTNNVAKSTSSIRVFKDENGNIYVEQPAYEAICVVPLISSHGVNIVVMPDGAESSLTEV